MVREAGGKLRGSDVLEPKGKSFKMTGATDCGRDDG